MQLFGTSIPQQVPELGLLRDYASPTKLSSREVSAAVGGLRALWVKWGYIPTNNVLVSQQRSTKILRKK